MRMENHMTCPHKRRDVGDPKVFQRTFDMTIHTIAEHACEDANVTIHPNLETVGFFGVS